jgi:hypothetical protein
MILKIFFLILFYFYLRTGIILDSIHTHSPHKELKIPSVHRIVMNIFILGLIVTGFYIFSWYFILILILFTMDPILLSFPKLYFLLKQKVTYFYMDYFPTAILFMFLSGVIFYTYFFITIFSTKL